MNQGQSQNSIEQSIQDKKKTILFKHQATELTQQLQHAQKLIKSKDIDLLEAYSHSQRLQEQLQKAHLEKKAITDKFNKKSAQLNLAHTAVNDMQNKMNRQTTDQRIVQTELQGQIRNKATEVLEVDGKYRQKYSQLKLLVNDYRMQMSRYKTIIESQQKEMQQSKHQQQQQQHQQQKPVQMDNWVQNIDKQASLIDNNDDQQQRNTPPQRPVEVPVKDSRQPAIIDQPICIQPDIQAPQHQLEQQPITIHKIVSSDDVNIHSSRRKSSRMRQRVKKNQGEDTFGDNAGDKVLGRKHFSLSGEDQVTQILEHPFSHYTTTDNECDENQPRRHEHMGVEERQRCAQRQAMTTEYQRTINKSAERLRSNKKQASDVTEEGVNIRALSVKQQSPSEVQFNDAYGNLVPPPQKVNLSQAALNIPSFQAYAKKVNDIDLMEQELLQKQLLRNQCQARYEKVCANRIRSVQQKQDKEQLEHQLDQLFTEINSLKLKLRGVFASRK